MPSPLVNVEGQPSIFSYNHQCTQPTNYLPLHRADNVNHPTQNTTPGIFLQGDLSIFRLPRTPYLPNIIDVDRRTCYDAVGADPRLAFLGAPSTDINSGVSHLLRRIRRTNGRRSMRAYFPDNCACRRHYV